jgi:hypothetical protein
MLLMSRLFGIRKLLLPWPRTPILRSVTPSLAVTLLMLMLMMPLAPVVMLLLVAHSLQQF